MSGTCFSVCHVNYFRTGFFANPIVVVDEYKDVNVIITTHSSRVRRDEDDADAGCASVTPSSDPYFLTGCVFLNAQ